MKKIHYPNTIRSHLVTIVLIAPFTPKSASKLRSALHFTYSIVIRRFIPALILLNPNNHYTFASTMHGRMVVSREKHLVY